MKFDTIDYIEQGNLRMQEGQVERGAIRTKFIVLIALVLVAIIGGIIYKQYSTGVAHRPEKVGDAFMLGLTEKDGGGTYAMFNDTRKKKVTADEWNSWVVFAFNNYNGGTPKVVKKENVPDPGHLYSKNDTVTRLRYQMHPNGKTVNFDVILTESGDTWKIVDVGEV